jgi:uracil-DNA glycosylase family 4
MKTFSHLNRAITRCTACPRLRDHCTAVARTKRAAFATQTYWGKPVPNLAPPDPRAAKILIVGLAPAAHGANRTGRVFTGDRSGDFLFRAMHQAGFCNQPTSTHAADGLELIDCAIAGVCRCAPPGNKPTPKEIESCRPFLDRTFELLKSLRGIVALGKLAFDESVRLLHRHDWHAALTIPHPTFAHGTTYRFFSDTPTHERASDNPFFLLATYHPSQQNTFTGRLTPAMLRHIFMDARRLMTLASGPGNI